jgi:septum formation protein
VVEEPTTILPPPILASASPRRRQWMEALRIPFEVWIPEVDETPLEGEEPGAMVARLARAKAESAARAGGSSPPTPPWRWTTTSWANRWTRPTRRAC